VRRHALPGLHYSLARPDTPRIIRYSFTIYLDTAADNGKIGWSQGIKPCRPLSTAVVSAQIAITASPISAAVVYMSSVMEGHGIS
ncbi:hypothetical protein ONJ87_25750, partial [Salmonella enterica subsp. enterica serovar Anatum]|nr:hypothetical protein [Salmonella enterica subsp. enterica serovar Anatum]